MLAFVAHEARMRAPADKEGRISTRVALTAAAARGVASAAAALAGPDCPEPLDYLWAWCLELDRTRTMGMHGPDPLTYPMIDAWARLTQRAPTPAEVTLLLEMDLVLRHPDALQGAA